MKITRPFYPGLILLTVAFISACSPSETSEETVEITEYTINYRHIGDSISLIAQQTLLMNVANGLQTNGAPETIDFCHIYASPLLDSLSKTHGVHISRISDRNRNPNNAASKDEQMILSHFAKGANDTVVENGNRHIYYKAIRIGMPGCLLCHGVPEQDIDLPTLDKIKKHYPNDRATGYHSGELRGAWKLEFED